MIDRSPTPNNNLRSDAWSNRILISGTAAILLLTLYPFRFSWHSHISGVALPFLLGNGGKGFHLRDEFLNVLLFVPFGFGLSQKLRGKGKSPSKTFLLVMASGALMSYSIEFMQFYIPSRDSGWDDILTNTTGAGVGFLSLVLCGTPLTRLLSRFESILETWLTPSRLAAFLLLYFCFWFGISIQLQKEMRLDNWEADSRLFVGNDAYSRPVSAWKGKVFRLQLWDRALPPGLAKLITAGGDSHDADAEMLASFHFSSPTPLRDETKFLPDLFWVPNLPSHVESNGAVFDGSTWLTSRDPVPALVKQIETTQQFSVRVLCASAEIEGAEGRIVSVSRAPGAINFSLWQDGTSLVFWFRTGLSAQRSQLAWHIPDVFALNQTRDILLSYDASGLSLHIDGRKKPHSFQLGPGAALVQWVRRPRPAELDGYNYLYYLLIFLPAGVIWGIAGSKFGWPKFKVPLALAIGFLFPAIVLEYLLAHVGRRSASPGAIALSLVITLVGGFWFNADRRSSSRMR